MTADETRTCPDCAEEIKLEARVCRYCGYRFDGGSSTSAEPNAIPHAAPTQEPHKRRSLRGLGWLAAVTVWLFTVWPLAVELADPPTGAEYAGGVVAAVLVSLGVAALIRVVYTMVRKRRFISPWLFVIAALVAFFSFAGQARNDDQGGSEITITREDVETWTSDAIREQLPAGTTMDQLECVEDGDELHWRCHHDRPSG